MVARLHFAHLPTAIEELPRLSDVLGGPRILVKRDDQTGLAFGGNKTRKLENQPIDYEGAPIAIPGKELGLGDFTKIPNGLPVVGDRLAILWTYGVGRGRLTPNQFVALTSTNPAKIFGLYPQKGSLLPGSDADIVIWDPERHVKYGVAHAHHRTDYNLFEGWELKGYPEKVFLRGTMIVDGNRWLGRAGLGKFLHRQPGAPVL